MHPGFRPALRAVESIVVPDRKHGRVLVLRDTQGIADEHKVIPPVLVPVVSRFTGRWTCAEIARDASAEMGFDVPVDVVERLAGELDEALLLEGPTFRAARERVAREFAQAMVRPASHAGGAYHGERAALARYIEVDCIGRATGSRQKDPASGAMMGLIAPHIDPWRGALAYGHAYGALASSLPPQADTFVLFGTSHAPMREPFALCRKAFDTPLGRVEHDGAALDELAAGAEGFDPYADQFNHKREHSLEFQVVFLKYVLGGRAFRIVPVLAGLGAHQAGGTHPAGDTRVAHFLDGVRRLAEARPGRVVVVAGADLAHVGPRFGDARPLDPRAREELERTDRESLHHATRLDADGFWTHVAQDLDERRVCGLAPIWSLLRALGGGGQGRVLHYEQTIDREDGSIVSHGTVAFFG
jgi:AmmeMemoRadiSam system protein B